MKETFLYANSNCMEVFSYAPNSQYINIGADSALVPSRRQANNWIHDDQIICRNMAYCATIS